MPADLHFADHVQFLDRLCHFTLDTLCTPLTSSTTQSIFDPVPPSLHPSVWTLGSKFSSGEPNTTTHVTRVLTCVLLQVLPIKTPMKMDLSACIVPPYCINIQTHAWHSSWHFRNLQADDSPKWAQRSKWHPWTTEENSYHTNSKMVVLVVNNQTHTVNIFKTLYLLNRTKLTIFPCRSNMDSIALCACSNLGLTNYYLCTKKQFNVGGHEEHITFCDIFSPQISETCS